MTPQRLVGIVLVIAGVILLIIGMNAPNAAADPVGDALAIRFMERTTWYIIGGLASALLGILLAMGAARVESPLSIRFTSPKD